MVDELEAKSFVIRSSYRISVMRALADVGELTPTSIAERTDIRQPHVSRALSELEAKDLVTLTVPESQHTGRLYALTQFGEEIWSEIHPVNWLGPIDEIPEDHRELVTFLQHEVGDQLFGVGYFDGANITNYFMPDLERSGSSEEDLARTGETLVEDFTPDETNAGGIAGELRYEVQSFTEFHRIVIYTDDGFVAVGLEPDYQFEYPALVEECLERLE